MARIIKSAELLPSDQKFLEPLRRYPQLPTHYIMRLAGHDDDYYYARDRIGRLADLNYLTRHKATRTDNISKHATFTINEKGLHVRRKEAKHRILQSIEQADIEIAVRASPDYEYITFHDMRQSGWLPPHIVATINDGKDPHRIPVRERYFVPDGAPFRIYSKKTDSHTNYLDEYDRDTESLGLLNSRRSVEEKLENYVIFFRKELYRAHYGFKHCMVRFIFTRPEVMQGAMTLFHNKHGSNSHFLFGSTKDWAMEPRYPRGAEIGRSFTRAYQWAKAPGALYYMTQ